MFRGSKGEENKHGHAFCICNANSDKSLCGVIRLSMYYCFLPRSPQQFNVSTHVSMKFQLTPPACVTLPKEFLWPLQPSVPTYAVRSARKLTIPGSCLPL